MPTMALSAVRCALRRSSVLSQTVWRPPRCSNCAVVHHKLPHAILHPRATCVVFSRSKFTYSPEEWAKDFPIAKKGQRQSPIDINIKAAVFDEMLVKKPLSISYKQESTVEATNTGLSIMVTCKQPSEVKGGPLTGTYRLEQFHFHWGAANDRGSEHTLNGKTFPAELHLVHWNSDKYKDINDALDKPDGLTVLGAFLKVGKKHKDFDILAHTVDTVKLKNKQSSVASTFDPACLLPKNTSRYWTYPGSLTTPPLHESVTWIMFEEVVELSEDQVKALRGLCFDHEDDCIVDNFRRPFALGNRVLRSSFK